MILLPLKVCYSLWNKLLVAMRTLYCSIVVMGLLLGDNAFYCTGEPASVSRIFPSSWRCESSNVV